jgi:hypothetical protein
MKEEISKCFFNHTLDKIAIVLIGRLTRFEPQNTIGHSSGLPNSSRKQGIKRAAYLNLD